MDAELLKVGQVIEVRGQKIKIKVFSNKNSAILVCGGDIIKNICVGNFLKISKGYSSIVCKVEGEYIQELNKDEKSTARFQKVSDTIERLIEVSVIGIIQNGVFLRGVVEIPLIFSEAYLLSNYELNLIFKFFKTPENAVDVGYISGYVDYKLAVDIQNLFASHIGIFGNTGSGKSNTLAKIYTELFIKSSNFCSFSQSNFLVIDFNGEYESAFNCIADRMVYRLSTRKADGDKLPVPNSILEEVEFWSIICEATEKTQLPFLKRCIKLYLQLSECFTTSGARGLSCISEKIESLLWQYFEDPSQIKTKQSIFLNLAEQIVNDIQPIRNIYDKIEVHAGSGGKTPTLRINPSTYLNTKEQFAEHFLKPILAVFQMDNLRAISRYDLFDFSVHFNYLNELVRQYIIDEHVAPLIKRFDSRAHDLLKLFAFCDTPTQHQVEIVSLVDVNLAFKKIIPMLLCKNRYEKQKIAITVRQETSLHIIIDEAHNILSPISERENSTWKDYRLETFEEIIKEGRKFGVFMTISSQRPSDISSTIVSQLHNYFIHRLVNNEDIKMIGKAVAFIDSASYDMIPVLPQGGCIFTGVASNFPVVIQVELLDKESRPRSNTIDLLDIWSNPLA